MKSDRGQTWIVLSAAENKFTKIVSLKTFTL